MTIDRRDGTTRKPVPSKPTVFPESKPERGGRGRGSSGVPESQRPAPHRKVTD